MRLLPVVYCLFVWPAIVRAEIEPVHKLTYRTDGNDLIVSTELLISGTPHLLLTSIDNTEALAPGLRYTIIQNSDYLNDRAKYVTVAWRLKNYGTKVRPTQVSGQTIALSTAELKQLGGKALDLVKE
jgi:hypothetical protein